jgi:hypothetical protein
MVLCPSVSKCFGVLSKIKYRVSTWTQLLQREGAGSRFLRNVVNLAFLGSQMTLRSRDG